MDQGGELYHNPHIVKLLQTAGYNILHTGADTAHQNGFVETSNRPIGDDICAMLHGSDLPVKFWPYAFHFYFHIKNLLPRHGDGGTLPSLHELLYNKKADLTNLCTFGTRVWV